ncbi:MAG: NADH-quinone oxidoreductase subunit J, partial [Anaerolineales bacterium]
MTPDLILFLALAIVAVAAALGMLFSTNAIYSALFLILNFATVAVFFLMLGAPFIALAQIVVYAGAIMVLFLFVIMLLGAEKLRQKESLPWQQPLAITLGVLLLLEAVYVIFIRTPSPA